MKETYKRNEIVAVDGTDYSQIITDLLESLKDNPDVPISTNVNSTADSALVTADGLNETEYGEDAEESYQLIFKPEDNGNECTFYLDLDFLEYGRGEPDTQIEMTTH